MKHAAFAAALLVVALPAAVRAQPAPGSEFRVNRYTTGTQQFPSVAADAQGNFVVAWADYEQEGQAGVFARRLSSSGRALGPELHVNAYTTGVQQIPVVGAAADGRALVAWMDIGRDGDENGIFARRLDARGQPLGDEFQVNVYTTGSQTGPCVAADEDGGFLVVWNPGWENAAHARRIGPDGTPAGGEIVVASMSVSSLARRPGGGWLAFGSAGPPYDVFGVPLDESGAPAGPLFAVNTYTTGDQNRPKVGFDAAGGFVVAWDSRAPPDFGSVRVRRFDAQAQPLGPDFDVVPEYDRVAASPSVAVGADGTFTVAWTDQYGFDWDIWARRFAADGTPRGPEFQVNVQADFLQLTGGAAVLPGGQIVTSWTDAFSDDISARLYGMIPQGLVVDGSPDASNVNGVLEPGETVRVAPRWANRDQASWTLDGSATSFGGPGDPALYAIADGAAGYGFVEDGGSLSCADADDPDCFRVALASGPRPAFHWDSVFDERLSNGYSMRWTLHVGRSFADVAADSHFTGAIETLLHHGVTAGCGAGAYCPAAVSSREQMAVFVLSAHEGAGYQPRACAAPMFPDVPASSPFCRFVEELARRGVVGGCGGGHYCPGSPVTRQEMAVFVLRTKEPSFTPPDCTTPMFADVPATSPYCRWIEELARRGVVAGCGGGNYCPDAPVTREQMAVFITGGFGLTLYGP